MFLLTTYSCRTHEEDIAIFDPVLTSEDLTGETLRNKGFKKVISGLTIFYVYKDDVREIKYEVDDDQIVGRAFRIRFDDQKQFLSLYNGEILETHDKDDIIKFRIRNQEVSGKVITEMDGKYIEIFTDWFHITMH
jgi:hypothetical protein